MSQRNWHKGMQNEKQWNRQWNRQCTEQAVNGSSMHGTGSAWNRHRDRQIHVDMEKEGHRTCRGPAERMRQGRRGTEKCIRRSVGKK